MGFIESVRSGFLRYVTFSGRASRSAYWYWMLFQTLVNIVCLGVDHFLFDTPLQGDKMGPLYTASSILLLLPSLAVFSRRMHDTNHRAWWLLLAGVAAACAPLLIPLLVGMLGQTGMTLGMLIVCAPTVVILLWLCSKGTAGDNRFGPDPLMAVAV